MYLAGLDMDDPMFAGPIEVFGSGFFLEIKDTGASPSHFTVQQVGRKSLQAYEWRQEEREIKMEFGTSTRTHWWEIYHTSQSLDINGVGRLLRYLKMLYGDGPTHVGGKGGHSSSRPATGGGTAG